MPPRNSRALAWTHVLRTRAAVRASLRRRAAARRPPLPRHPAVRRRAGGTAQRGRLGRHGRRDALRLTGGAGIAALVPSAARPGAARPRRLLPPAAARA